MSSGPSRQSGWSVQVGRAFGIPIRIHFTFLLLLVWYGLYSSRQGNDVVLAISLLLLVFGCVLLHELGHALMARRFGVMTREIVLYPIGGIARLENMPPGKAELFIALAGPAVNLALAVLLVPLVLVQGLASGASLADGKLLQAAQLVRLLLAANLILFFFNLIPAFPMDGGRVLRAALALKMPAGKATEIAAAVGQGASILFAIAGIVGKNPVLMIIALFVFIGASQETFFYRQRAAVEGKTARDAMITRFEVLAPQDSLTQAAERLLATHQQDFPVVDSWERVAGILPRGRLLEGLAQAGGSTPVMEIMERRFPRAAPEDDLQHILQLLRARPQCPVVVLEDERIVGMVTLENLTEFIEVTRRRGGSESDDAPAPDAGAGRSS